MHEFVLNIFKFIKSLLHFLRIVCVFCIMLLILYWIQNLTGAEWAWLSFIKPFLDALLVSADKIYSLTFDFFGATFELKYMTSVIILTLLSYIFKLLSTGFDFLEGLYMSARFIYRKTEENLMNKKLKEDITREEKRLSKYTIVIHTKIKKKFAHQEININIDEQNKLMNDFILSKTSLKPAAYQGGFMYCFDNFEKIDNTLDILFKLLKSNAPLDYAICVQVGDHIKELNKLIDLQNYGKITMAADTSYRYRFNETHKYQTSQIGLFQFDNNTLEVHEFKEIL